MAEPWFCAQKNLLWNTNVPLIDRPELFPLVPCLWSKLYAGDSWFNKRFSGIFHLIWESVPLFLELSSFSDFIGFIVNVFLLFLPFAVKPGQKLLVEVDYSGRCSVSEGCPDEGQDI